MIKKAICILVLILYIPLGNAWCTDTHQGNVLPNLRLSFTERFRMVTWDNAISLAESADAGNSFTRQRTSFMAQWFPYDEVELALKLTNEFRYYFVPGTKDFDLDEILIDQLYVKWNTNRYLPGTLTLGRQNIRLGEGFLVMDGHPLDGSRSVYFNAARYDWQIDPQKNLTLFYTYQPETDDILPLIHDQDRGLIEQPEEGIGAYFTAQLSQANLQAYVIRKNIDDTDSRPIHSHINSFGGRAQIPLARQLQGTIEGTYQVGTYGDADRSAFGGYGHADYQTGWGMYAPKSFTAGGIYLSGDDPETEDWEGWDPLFSRWPEWSESYIYTLIREGGVAYWSNLAAVYARTQVPVAPNMNVSLGYFHLMAPEDYPATAAFPAGGSGRNRGDLLVGRFNYRINEHWSGHLLWEHFEPGNYYFDEADGYDWARVELMLTL